MTRKLGVWVIRCEIKVVLMFFSMESGRRRLHFQSVGAGNGIWSLSLAAADPVAVVISRVDPESFPTQLPEATGGFSQAVFDLLETAKVEMGSDC